MRYFPESVSELPYYYLVLIRPLVQHLEKHVLGKSLAAEQSYYLWPARRSLKIERPSSLYVNVDDYKTRRTRRTIFPTRAYTTIIRHWQRQGFWPTESMSCALKESCKLVRLPYDPTTSSYRQLAIGTAKKHLLVLPLYNIATKKPKDQLSTSTELILQRLFAWHAGHDLKEHVRTYGLDADYPRQFSSGLLDLY